MLVHQLLVPHGFQHLFFPSLVAVIISSVLVSVTDDLLNLIFLAEVIRLKVLVSQLFSIRLCFER